MKHLKYFLLILCVSFTAVVMLNAGLVQIGVSFISINAHNIMTIFEVCLMIAFLCVIMNSIPKMRDYPMIYSYIIVISVAMSVHYISDQDFFFHHFFEIICSLTCVYLVVWACIYISDYKDIQKLNKKLKNEQ